MSSPSDSYDYAEGASAVEIDRALFSREDLNGPELQHASSSSGVRISIQQRHRRDSQVGSAYEGGGGAGSTIDPSDLHASNNDAIFDGYGARAIPSSVTSMHHDRVIAIGRESRRSTISNRPSWFRRAGSTSSFADSATTARRRESEDHGSRSAFLSGEDGEPGSGPVFASDDEVASPDELEDDSTEEGRISIRTRSSRHKLSIRRSRKISEQSSQRRSTVFDSIAGIFSRPSLSVDGAERPEYSARRSSASDTSRRHRPRSRRASSTASLAAGVSDRGEDADSEESWGYSSNEEDVPSPDAISLAPSFTSGDSMYGPSSEGGNSRPHSPTTSLPLIRGTSDPFFGDTRIDVELGFEDLYSTTLPAGGPRSRQKIYIEDEDMTVLFVGCEVIWWRRLLWRAACFVTVGMLGLAGLWMPTLWLRWVTKEKAFARLGEIDSGESLIVVEVCRPTPRRWRVILT
jgi:cation-transporting ATPase 13A3/4/5